MISEEKVKMYCCEDASKIENYAEAVADQTQTWDIHHELEIQGQFTNSRELLIKCGIYYDVPASQLIFLKHAEHQRLHKKDRPKSEETRRKLSEARKGRPGYPHSERAKRKISEAKKGRPNGWTGRRHSEDTKRKMAEARREYWRKRKTAMSK